jgi:hypothetical protein
MAASPAQLRNQARKLDRLNVRASSVVAAMRRGATLHMRYEWYGAVWWLSSGARVDEEVARIVTQDANVADVGDALFHDAVAQTWRWIED